MAELLDLVGVSTDAVETGRDDGSKDFFRLMQTLVSVRIAEWAKTNAQLPVLTVPVSR